jgi:hypothetical protein
MTLRNLLGVSIEAITPDNAMLRQLLDAAQRNINDASANVISAETRFDAAYKAIMQLAMAALHANGYRTLTSKPGHHQTAIQGLMHSIGLKNDPVWSIDSLGQQRHLNDYAGALVSESAVKSCLTQAKELNIAVAEWIRLNKPELL